MVVVVVVVVVVRTPCDACVKFQASKRRNLPTPRLGKSWQARRPRTQSLGHLQGSTFSIALALAALVLAWTEQVTMYIFSWLAEPFSKWRYHPRPDKPWRLHPGYAIYHQTPTKQNWEETKRETAHRKLWCSGRALMTPLEAPQLRPLGNPINHTIP